MNPVEIMHEYERGHTNMTGFQVEFIHALTDENAADSIRQLPDDLRAALVQFVKEYWPTRRIIRGTLPSPEQIARVREWLAADAAAREAA